MASATATRSCLPVTQSNLPLANQGASSCQLMRAVSPRISAYSGLMESVMANIPLMKNTYHTLSAASSVRPFWGRPGPSAQGKGGKLDGCDHAVGHGQNQARASERKQPGPNVWQKLLACLLWYLAPSQCFG